MVFQLNWLLAYFIVQFVPLKAFNCIVEIDGLEIREDSLVCIVASMNVKDVVEEDCNMIGPAGDVSALDFDFSPSGVEAIFMAGLDEEFVVMLFGVGCFLNFRVFHFL